IVELEELHVAHNTDIDLRRSGGHGGELRKESDAGSCQPLSPTELCRRVSTKGFCSCNNHSKKRGIRVGRECLEDRSPRDALASPGGAGNNGRGPSRWPIREGILHVGPCPL